MTLIKRKKKKASFKTTTKRALWFCLANGISWVWCSYVLAFLGREQIAEDLSKVAVTQIIGVFLVYALKSLLENFSKNNKWPDKPTVEIETETDEDPEEEPVG